MAITSSRQGYGLAPFGASAFGLGLPAHCASSTFSVRADASGIVHGSRAIDPKTGRYLYGDNGTPLGMSDVRQLVTIRYRTVFGSASDRSLGHRFDRIRKVTPDVIAEVRSEAQAAVQDIIDAGYITFDGVRLDVQSGGPLGAVVYLTDLTSQRQLECPV